MPTWTRSKYQPGGGDAHVEFIVYSSVPLAGLTASRSRHGLPDSAARFPLRLDHLARDEHPHRFGELHAPIIWRRAAVDCPDIDIDALRAANHQVRISVNMPDPDSLEYLRAAWGFARAVCDAVPVLGIFDVHASRWWTSSALAAVPVSASFDVRREISVSFETSASYGHVCHSRGMRKMGRPDVVICGLRANEPDRAHMLITAVAGHLAMGTRLKPLVLLPDFTASVEDYSPNDNAPQLYLNNRAVVLDRR